MRGGSYGCSAVQYSDQKVCNKCGLTWDMNDDDPPDCRTPRELKREKARQNMAKLRQTLDLPHVSP